MTAADSSKPIGFSVGTGRCGTSLMTRLMAEHADIHAFHELNPLNETLHRYAKWYDLPIDDAGFLYHKAQEIGAAHNAGGGFFESSAYLSLSVPTLFERFGGRYVLMIRHPEKVINSYIKKGWYTQPVLLADENKAPGLQPMMEMHHSLGRPIAQGDEFAPWLRMGQAGKLAWYWDRLNRRVLDAFATLPEGTCRVQRLEDMTYESYRELAAFLGSANPMPEDRYHEIADSRPNAFTNLPVTADWSTEDRADVLREAGALAEKMGYDLSHLTGGVHGA